jgi:hypothetical protein
MSKITCEGGCHCAWCAAGERCWCDCRTRDGRRASVTTFSEGRGMRRSRYDEDPDVDDDGGGGGMDRREMLAQLGDLGYDPEVMGLCPDEALAAILRNAQGDEDDDEFDDGGPRGVGMRPDGRASDDDDNFAPAYSDEGGGREPNERQPPEMTQKPGRELSTSSLGEGDVGGYLDGLDAEKNAKHAERLLKAAEQGVRDADALPADRVDRDYQRSAARENLSEAKRLHRQFCERRGGRGYSSFSERQAGPAAAAYFDRHAKDLAKCGVTKDEFVAAYRKAGLAP